MSNLPSADDMVKMLKMLITFAMCTTQLKSKRECWSCIWCCLISSNPWYPSLQEVVALRNTENRFFRSIMSIAELSEWHMGNYLSQNSEWNHFTESYCCNKWMHATDFAEPSIALSSDLDVGIQSNYQPQPKSEPPPQPRLHPQPKQHKVFNIHEICRDQWSRKFFPGVVLLWEISEKIYVFPV